MRCTSCREGKPDYLVTKTIREELVTAPWCIPCLQKGVLPMDVLMQGWRDRGWTTTCIGEAPQARLV